MQRTGEGAEMPGWIPFEAIFNYLFFGSKNSCFGRYRMNKNADRSDNKLTDQLKGT